MDYLDNHVRLKRTRSAHWNQYHSGSTLRCGHWNIHDLCVTLTSHPGRLAASVAIVAFLTACAAQQAAPAEADELIRHFDLNDDFEVDQAGEAQLDAMRDGEVTQEEYNAGFERFRVCLRDAGYEMRDVELIGVVWEGGIPKEAVDSGAEEECYIREYKFVDVIWQVSNQDDTEALHRMNYCLGIRGLATATTLSSAEQMIDEIGLDYAACDAEYEEYLEQSFP